MLISKAEMDALRVTGVYMDAPAKIFEGIGKNVLGCMLADGYLKFDREHTCLRLTEGGAEILRQAGLRVREYVYQSKERVLTRRLQGAETAMFFCGLGIDVFLKSFPDEAAGTGYLATAEIRRQKGENVLGRSKFFGLLYTSDTTYAVYNVSDPAEILYPGTEEDVFDRRLFLAGNPAKILYVSDKPLTAMAEAYVKTPPAEIKKDGNKISGSFYQVVEHFTMPVCFVPNNAFGAVQLQIMQTENYRDILAWSMVPKSYSKPLVDYIDAIHSKGYLLVFIDFNVKRLEKALVYGDKLSILVLKEQEEALEILLKGRETNVACLSQEEVLQALKIKPLENRRLKQFTTEKGVGVFAKRFNKNHN